MASNAGRGASAKGRTKKWLQRRGYDVADMEVVRFIYTRNGMIPSKRDQWGADLAAMNENHIVLVQVKSGKQCTDGSTYPAARRAFAKFTMPAGVKRWIIAWPPRARQPIVVSGRTGERLL